MAELMSTTPRRTLVLGDAYPPPGPGEYDSGKVDRIGKGMLGDAPSYTMARRTPMPAKERANWRLTSDGPGPLAYSPRTLGPQSIAPTGQSNPAYSMPQTRRFDSSETPGPGPCKYDNNQTSIGKGSAVFTTSMQREGKCFYGETYARDNLGKHSPGPMATKVRASNHCGTRLAASLFLCRAPSP
eukprot:scaffold219369_cov34-Tisochrysis_lutea.AAC.1